MPLHGGGRALGTEDGGRVSIVVLNEVLDSSRSKSTARTLMVVLAEQAHEDGICWPGITRLAQRVNTSGRNIQLLTRELEDMGELLVDYGAGRGNTNVYRVLPPLTLNRLLADLTEQSEKVKSPAEKVKVSALIEALEKVKDRAEKVKASAPLSGTEKVKDSAQKVKSSAEKVKSSAEKVKASSPEPSRTVKNRQEPVVVSPGQDEIFDPETALPTHAPVQVPQGPSDAGETDTTSTEDVPPAAASLAALREALSPWSADKLIAERTPRQSERGWLSLAPERIWELRQQAFDKHGNRYRGDLCALLDAETTKNNTANGTDAAEKDWLA